jgi:hypothetical protein
MGAPLLAMGVGWGITSGMKARARTAKLTAAEIGDQRFEYVRVIERQDAAGATVYRTIWRSWCTACGSPFNFEAAIRPNPCRFRRHYTPFGARLGTR